MFPGLSSDSYHAPGSAVGRVGAHVIIGSAVGGAIALLLIILLLLMMILAVFRRRRQSHEKLAGDQYATHVQHNVTSIIILRLSLALWIILEW